MGYKSFYEKQDTCTVQRFQEHHIFFLPQARHQMNVVCCIVVYEGVEQFVDEKYNCDNKLCCIKLNKLYIPISASSGLCTDSSLPLINTVHPLGT